MVSQFPLDYMHSVCLGVNRRLLSVWFKAGKGTFKLRQNAIDVISHQFDSLRPYVPSDFAR